MAKVKYEDRIAAVEKFNKLVNKESSFCIKVYH